jgi:hypothetical protein
LLATVFTILSPLVTKFAPLMVLSTLHPFGNKIALTIALPFFRSFTFNIRGLQIMKIHRSIRALALFALAATAVMTFSAYTHAVEGFALLKGLWRCQEDGAQSSLEFRSQNQLVFNGQSANYQLQPGAFTVMEDTGPATYFYHR